MSSGRFVRGKRVSIAGNPEAVYSLFSMDPENGATHGGGGCGGIRPKGASRRRRENAVQGGPGDLMSAAARSRNGPLGILIGPVSVKMHGWPPPRNNEADRRRDDELGAR